MFQMNVHESYHQSYSGVFSSFLPFSLLLKNAKSVLNKKVKIKNLLELR